MINYLISKVFALTFYLQELVTNPNLEKGEIQNWGKIIKTWLIEQGIAENYANYMKIAIFIVVLAILCFIANFITKKIILSILAIFIKKSKTEWDDILLEKKVFNRISHFAPAIVIYYLIEPVLANNQGWVNTIQSGTYIYMIIVGMLVLISFFNDIGEIYNRLPAAKNRSIKSYLQVVKIFIYFISGILIISIVMGKSPGYFLGGLGAMAAIDVLKDIINNLDIVLIMSVNPGFGGQKFIENTYNKIKQCKELIKKNNAKTLIEVDGGVNNLNAGKLVENGADILVAGNYIFKSDDMQETIDLLKKH